ncbi:MAG: FAD-dependent oxidoreductase [Burkholderiales bacterium]|nr:NADP oxidoreductase [Burkholderiales bacterium]MDQ3196092.1 NADP oxidoreductase [Pseudomonadota bacterium]
MSGELGSARNPLRVAIVGSGPSGFYAAEALFRSKHFVCVDMLEKLPAPYGLVRNGVAPDHPKLKEAILVYDKIARTPHFNFFGNVTVGRDISVEELRRTHHALIFACGAETDRRLGIRGEDLPGSHTATEFVGWYNGHPNYRDHAFDLSHEVAVIVGQGNVAADVCRILAKPVDQLRHTDIADHALGILAGSKVRQIHLVGRRGPAQAKFTSKELRELGDVMDCDPIVAPEDLVLNPESTAELADKNNTNNARNLEIFRSFAARSNTSKHRRIFFHFLRSPVALVGNQRLEGVVLAQNYLEGDPFHQVARETCEILELQCGLLFRSIGYRGIPIPNVPFDEGRGIFPNRDGRLLNGSGGVSLGFYATGWIKRGPTGIIGTNRADSVATVKALIEDLPIFPIAEKPGVDALRSLLAQRDRRYVSYADWLKIDAAETGRGAPKGKPREKFTRIEEMLAYVSD